MKSTITNRLSRCAIVLILISLVAFLLLIFVIQLGLQNRKTPPPLPLSPSPSSPEDINEKCPFEDGARYLNSVERIKDVSVIYRDESVQLPRCSSITGRRIAINFGSACCKNSQQINCKSAIKIGGFDICIMFGPESIDAEFKKRNIDPLLKHNKRGYGYWIWKPYIILK